MPYEVRLTNTSGRAAFLTAPVKKGTLVTVGYAHNSEVIFSIADEYRRFLYAVERELTCSVLHWTYCEQGDESVQMGFDDSNLENHDDRSAFGCPLGEMCGGKTYALRDVAVGEMLTSNYADDGYAACPDWFENLLRAFNVHDVYTMAYSGRASTAASRT